MDKIYPKHSIESKRRISLGLIKSYSKISSEEYQLLLNDSNLKWCPACRKCLAKEDFYASASKADGYWQYCRKCLLQKNAEQRKTEKGKLANKYRVIKYHYGLSKDEYNKLIVDNPFCPICEKVFNENRRPHVDHNHKTNLVRGILCDVCNRGIGYLQEDISSLKNAIRYLRETNK